MSPQLFPKTERKRNTDSNRTHTHTHREETKNAPIKEVKTGSALTASSVPSHPGTNHPKGTNSPKLINYHAAVRMNAKGAMALSFAPAEGPKAGSACETAHDHDVADKTLTDTSSEDYTKTNKGSHTMTANSPSGGGEPYTYSNKHADDHSKFGDMTEGRTELDTT